MHHRNSSDSGRQIPQYFKGKMAEICNHSSWIELPKPLQGIGNSIFENLLSVVQRNSWNPARPKGGVHWMIRFAANHYATDSPPY